MRGESVGHHADEGFTLIEVLVALTVLSVAMTGLGAFFVNGSLTVAHQRDFRNAAVLASNALEQVRALEEAALLAGRGQDKVVQQFQTAETGPFKDRLKPYFDQMKREGIAGSTEGENAPLPTEPKTFTVGDTSFKQSIFVGPCEVYVAIGDDCVIPMALTDPKRPTDATTILEYFRVVVLVTWTSKSCTANAGRCGHVASTLISRKADDASFSSKRGWPEIQQPYMKTFYRGISDIFVKMGARGGNLPNHWSAVNLPDGLAIDAVTGNITGTPTKVGIWTYATTGTYIRVVENEPPAGSVSIRSDREEGLRWTVVNPPTLTLAPPPTTYTGDPVSLKPAVTGGVGPFTYTVDPPLPDRLTLNADGSITGIAIKSYTTTLTVTDSNGIKGTLKITHNVLNKYPPLTLPAIADQRFPVLSMVSFSTPATGGNGVYTYSATGLPTELAINPSTGAITGLPVLTPGRYLPTVTVTDGIGGKATATFVLEITTSGLKFTAPTGNVTTVRNQWTTLAPTTNAAAIGAKGTKISVVGPLPPGLGWSKAKETISGTPLLPGVYPVTLSATSSTSGQSALFTFLWTVS